MTKRENGIELKAYFKVTPSGLRPFDTQPRRLHLRKFTFGTQKYFNLNFSEICMKPKLEFRKGSSPPIKYQTTQKLYNIKKGLQMSVWDVGND